MMADNGECRTRSHISRRTLIKAAGAAGLAWLTPVSHLLANQAEGKPRRTPARSVIVLWLAGAPSQLETFDPHPGTMIAGGTGAIKTSVKGVHIAEGLPQVAGQMHDISVVRSVVSKEGDHERATYNMKTGFRPDPTLVHPSIGAITCHQMSAAGTEIPRHISILPNQWPGRGGYLGDKFDAFKVYDPKDRIGDIKARVEDKRQKRRLNDLDVIERSFARRRIKDLEDQKTLHRTAMQKALRMMSSEQLNAFDISNVSKADLDAYGDTPFGRGCLAAVRLVETGVRCIEVTLNGWDTHLNNHELHANLNSTLDPAFAALIQDLRRRGLLDTTVVMCGGEFGRTPKINGVAGRDHWPHGFSIALAGGGIRGGHIVGATDPDGSKEVDRPVRVMDIHATVLHAMGIDYAKIMTTPIGRPMRLCDGAVIKDLLVHG